MSLIKATIPDTFAQDDDAMNYIKGKLHTVKTSPLFKSDAKFREYVKAAWKSAKQKPEYRALAATAEYRELENILSRDSAEAQDAWNVNDSKLIDEISKESIRALDAFSAYLAKQERLVVNTKAALAKAKQGGNLAEIKWLADALGEFENELRKARALV